MKCTFLSVNPGNYIRIFYVIQCILIKKCKKSIILLIVSLRVCLSYFAENQPLNACF